MKSTRQTEFNLGPARTVNPISISNLPRNTHNTVCINIGPKCLALCLNLSFSSGLDQPSGLAREYTATRRRCLHVLRGYYRHISKIFVSSVFRMPRFTGMTMHDLSPDPAPSRIEKDYRMIDSDCCADLESSMQCTCTCTVVLESTKFPCMPGLRRERSIKPRSQAAAHKQQNVSIDTLMG